MTEPKNFPPRFLAPEVVQTSAMDCGPATLKSLLEGFDIPVSYGRLREACQTDVDGASINTLEGVLNQLGLEAEQVVAPLDHLLLSEEPITPALVVVSQPNGLTHFVLLWRLHAGRLVQVMDPAQGRRWLSPQRFLDEVYVHRMPFAANVWREWAGSDGFCDPLRWRLTQLGLDQMQREQLLTLALDDPTWQSLAALDAATRMVTALVETGGLTSGEEAGRVLAHLFDRARQQAPGADNSVPSPYWLVHPLPPTSDSDEAGPQLMFQGAVLLQVFGRWPLEPETEEPSEAEDQPDVERDEAPTPPPRSPALAAALAEKPERPELELGRLLHQDGLLSPAIISLAVLLAAAGVIIEAMLLGSLIDIGQSPTVGNQLLPLMAALLVLAGLLFMLEIPLAALILRLGRRLELHWRLAFLTKIPRLDPQYFHSRLTSDMANRAHQLYKLRRLPLLGFNFLRLGFQLLWTVVGIAWLDLGSAPLALLAAVLAVAVPLAAHPLLAQLDQRLQAHAGGLSLFYLDGLLGLTPIRAHNAAPAMRREHEALLVAWSRANVAFYRLLSSVEGVTALINTGLAVAIVLAYVARGGESGLVLLLAYWSFQIVVLGKAIGDLAQQYPRQRNRLLTLLEPLNAPEQGDVQLQALSIVMNDDVTNDDVTNDGTAEDSPAAAAPPPTNSNGAAILDGAAILMKEVSVLAGGHLILDRVTVSITAGEHIAIVGPSGAGKSSLISLLLGWYRLANGQILVDGQPLTRLRMGHLRRQTVWVDPAVQLWNRTFLYNLHYGSGGGDINMVLSQANLVDVLKRLPAGMQTPLGEGGGLVSGGEGQRVRLGRGMMRPEARLVILDEPFRGLDREQRRELLTRARRYWPTATLLCITHDVAQTEIFERVMVVEDGRLVEDDAPAALAARPNSRYRALLSGEAATRRALWGSPEWRRLWLERGQLREETSDAARLYQL